MHANSMLQLVGIPDLDSFFKDILVDEEDAESEPDNFCLKCWANLHIPLHLALFLVALLIWGTAWGILGPSALPGGPIFAVFIVVFMSYVGGELVKLVNLPPLLGMLVFGFAIRNIFPKAIGESMDPQISSTLRSSALVIILLRAGLGLDPSVLKKLSFVCFRLAFGPCLVEAITTGIIGHFVLGMPWLWSFMLGFVLGAVSPAVVVPCMLALEQKQLGVEKGIPTLIIAAASVDDVLAITCFGIVLGITFSQGNIVWTIFKGPVEAVIGIVYGLVLGFFYWKTPSVKFSSVWMYRTSLLIFGGLFSMFVSQRADFPGVGALGCLSLSFVAALKWRQEQSWHINGFENNTVNKYLFILWEILQPALFGLIGAELEVQNMKGDTVGLGIAVLACSLTLRLLTSFCAVTGAHFTLKERLFISIAWIPKATVQAAIGPVALDLARNTGLGPEQERLGVQAYIYMIQAAHQSKNLAIAFPTHNTPAGQIA